MSGILVVVEVVVTSNSCQLLVAFSRVNCFLIELTEQRAMTRVQSSPMFCFKNHSLPCSGVVRCGVLSQAAQHCQEVSGVQREEKDNQEFFKRNV